MALARRNSTKLEINLLTAEGLQPMLDVPIYGRIGTMELYRPPGASQVTPSRPLPRQPNNEQTP